MERRSRSRATGALSGPVESAQTSSHLRFLHGPGLEGAKRGGVQRSMA